MRLNDKGQCPECGRKPIPYKRDRKFFCVKCNRNFAMDTGEFVPNWQWIGPNTRKPHAWNCKCGDCPPAVAQETTSPSEASKDTTD